MSSYFYLHAKESPVNIDIISQLKEYSEKNKELIYLLDRPLTDTKYSYSYQDALILLSPKRKIAMIDCNNSDDEFKNYIEDVIEDIGSISDKYLYKEKIGRPRTWKSTLVESVVDVESLKNINSFFEKITIENELDRKKIELLISLFIGSINDIERVDIDVPVTLLDKVKQKILLFDGDQTRFIYESLNQKRIRIQGLSGTGKTELLLHKLKEVYTNDPNSRIFFTCFNRILADNLRTRIPEFFNFMKVEQQIEWDKRLWCRGSWGSGRFPNSGAYRYICDFYEVPFYSWSYQMSFERACQLAVKDIKAKKGESKGYAFTHMFIDESQDFNESFFQLCEMATEKSIYIAGDIFQSIFDENISLTIKPDFLLGKCYRTDPKTLMFAHGLGMGLFEKHKIRWLEEKEWKDCGYEIEKESKSFILKREPSRRFEDLEDSFESIRIVEIEKSFSSTIISIMREIVSENNTALPEDIGIILIDNSREIYELADLLEVKIQKEFGWAVNKAYETKRKVKDSVLISNRNNVKGLEFPFVICVTKRISNGLSYRNALYTMLTRSFIKSFLLTQPEKLSGLTNEMKNGLKQIIEQQQMVIQEPTEVEKHKIQTRFEYSKKKMSYFETVSDIFKELRIEKKYQEPLLKQVAQAQLFDEDREVLKEFISMNFSYLDGRLL